MVNGASECVWLEELKVWLIGVGICTIRCRVTILASDSLSRPRIPVGCANLVFDCGVLTHIIYHFLNRCVDFAHKRVEFCATVDGQFQRREGQFGNRPRLSSRTTLIVRIEVLSI